MKLTTVLVIATLPGVAQRRPGSPLERPPRNTEVIAHFGERADFSPDNQRIMSMAKSFGDAFVIDLNTRVIRCLTRAVPGAAVGGERFSDARTSRCRDNELWFRRPWRASWVSTSAPRRSWTSCRQRT